MHHFSDASVQGYGQCSYLRLEDEAHNVHCAFVMGKSRVAPLKPVTIPRLELTAAVCSVRISQQIHRELEYRIDEDFNWTESKVVLGYLNNESKRFHVYVANRVQEIQDCTDKKQWRYIESKQNPADVASRGMKAKELQDSRWILGPEFLWSKDCTWLNCDEQSHILRDDGPEVKKSVTMTTSSSGKGKSTLDERVERFSSWYRAQRAVALCMKYMKKLKARAKKEPEETVQVRAQDLEIAGKLIIHAAQFKAFKDQLKEPAKGKEDSSTHMTTKLYPVRKLDPYIDEDGVLRVGGRLKNADYADQVKHPIILPKESHVTKLIIKHYHEYTKHQGKGMTLNEIRSRCYWIIGGSSAVSTVIASCVTCRKLRGPVIEHCAFVMGKSRVAPLKPVTIPRLELTAAVCSVRISQQIHRELEYRIDEDFNWTESKVVLGYLNNESKRFHVYVANRVQEIQDCTDKKQDGFWDRSFCGARIVLG